MQHNVRLGLERVEQAIERAKVKSKQPRFGATQSNDAFFTSFMRWTTLANLEEPPYNPDSRERDKWLTTFWRREPHLAGVLSSVNAIDSNRGWHLTGGRNQVARYINTLRFAEDGAGWRHYISMQSTSYYTSDLGGITEVGRDGIDGPLRALYHVDPTRCVLTGKPDRPLKYDKNKKPWRRDDFFRLTSMRNIDETFHGLGYCAISRLLDLSKIMLAVYYHELEQLGARAPKGLLLMQNISQGQWNEAMQAREASLQGSMRQYYDSVAVIAQEGVDAVDAKLIALSQLPAGFDLEVFTNLLMYGYALCFGYDPIEFWPVLAGQLGRGRETDIQHRKGTGKGGMNFMLAFQDQMQLQLPETVAFDFEQRDQEGVLLDASVAQAWANVATTLYGNGNRISGPPDRGRKPNGENAEDGTDIDEESEPGSQTGWSNEPGGVTEGILTRQEVRTLLVNQGIIPSDWTEGEEDVSASDVSGKKLRTRRDELLENENIRRAVYQFPNEPIVRYHWPSGRSEILFEEAQEALTRSSYHVLKPTALIPDFLQEEAEPDLSLEDRETLIDSIIFSSDVDEDKE